MIISPVPVQTAPFGVPHMPPAPDGGWWAANLGVLLAAWAAFVAVLVLSGLLGGTGFLAVGADSDDMMRFVQLRDVLEGQDWRDTSQQRLGPDGTPIHWSRLADLPFLIVAWPLSGWLGTEMALRIAGTVVPPLLSFLFVAGVLRGMSALLGQARLSAAAVLAVMLFAVVGRKFGMGSFDHHHLQIGLFALALGVTLVRAPTTGEGVLAGVAAGACAVVGLEAAPQLAALCTSWALLWAFDGDRAVLPCVAASGGRTRPTLAFGASLAVTSALGMLVFTGRKAIDGPVCDAFGAPVAGLLILGGAGLAVFAGLSATSSGPDLRGRLPRIGALAVLGAAAVGGLLVGAPECAANPLDAMSRDVHLIWLENIREAAPLAQADHALKAAILGPALAALVVAVWGARSGHGARRTAYAVAGVMTVIGLLMSVYQIRFSTFVVVGVAMLAGSVVAACLDAPASLRSRGGLLLAALSSQSILWAAGATYAQALTGSTDTSMVAYDESDNAPVAACTAPEPMAALAALPRGLVFADMNRSPFILMQTGHSAFASNYHRGWRDIDTLIDITRSDVPEAVSSLREAGVDYLYACRSGDELFSAIPLENGSPLYSALAAGLADDAAPVAGLRRIDGGKLDGAVIYAVE